MEYNQDLIKRQGLTEEDIKQLDVTYEKLKNLFLLAEEQTSSIELAKIAMQVEEVEFELQRIWKFEQNDAMHTYWYRIPHCECPVYDNRDLFGTGNRIYLAGCPVHMHLILHRSQSKMRH